MTTIDIEAPPVAALSPQMLTYAQSYIDARKRAGYAWLDMGRCLCEARDEAKHGEWGAFLQATNTHEDWAKRLIAIYMQSLSDRAFADAMRTNFLSVATGYELTSAPPDVRDRLLSGDAPPTVKQIRDEKRQAANPAPAPDLAAAPFWQSIDAHHPTAHFWTRERPDLLRSACGMTIQNRLPSGATDGGHCNSCVRATWQEQPADAPAQSDLPPDYAIVQRRLNQRGIALTTRMDGQTRMFVTMRAGKTVGIATPTWANVVDSLEYQERKEEAATAPVRRTCPTCGEPILNGLWGDLGECGECFHAKETDRVLLAKATRAIADGDTERARALLGQITIATAERDQLLATFPPLSLQQLDDILPKALSDAGYFWFAALPPTIANNDGWRGDAPTVEAALQLAVDRETAKAARLSPAQYVAAMDLLGKLRGDIVAGVLDTAADRARALIAILEAPERERP